jgi:hypothetical protein
MALVVLSTDSQCIRCGCTDSQACEGGCSWAVVDRNVRQGICSNCVDPEDDDERQ